MVTAGVLAAFSAEQQVPALVTLTVLVGLFQVLLGLFRWDGFLRFVSNAVLTGFMNGIAVVIVLGQLGRLTGYSSATGNRLTQTLDLHLHLNQVDIATTAIGLGAIALILGLERTRLKQFNLMLAGVAPSVIKQLTKTYITDTVPLTDIFPATPILGESVQRAQAAAEAWLLTLKGCTS